MKSKIEELCSIKDIKECFQHLKNFYLTYRYEVGNLENYLKDIYDTMIFNFENNIGIQFSAKIAGVIVGNIITSNDGDNELLIKSILVEKKFQKEGIARKFLKKINHVAKSKGYKSVKIEEREGANGFYVRAGFIPYLCIYIRNSQDIEKVKERNIYNYKIVKEGFVGDDYVIKYDIEEETIQGDKIVFKKADKNIDAKFIYEKRISK